jgi:hypothetical protein
VLKGKSGGALTVSRNDQRRDLDDLALTPGVGTGVPLRPGNVPLRGGLVAALCCYQGQEGLLDRVHPAGLGRQSRGVMTAACARRLTRS